jgi:hypothetical protein
MASAYTLTSSRFPNGTTVYANPVNSPPTSPVSAVVVNGSATFSGLRELEQYVAHATIGSPDVDGAGVRFEQVTFTTDGGAASDSVKGVVVWDGTGSLPARPTATSVEWITPTDPAANALDGDTWTPTEG